MTFAGIGGNWTKETIVLVENSAIPSGFRRHHSRTAIEFRRHWMTPWTSSPTPGRHLDLESKTLSPENTVCHLVGIGYIPVDACCERFVIDQWQKCWSLGRGVRRPGLIHNVFHVTFWGKAEVWGNFPSPIAPSNCFLFLSLLFDIG